MLGRGLLTGQDVRLRKSGFRVYEKLLATGVEPTRLSPAQSRLRRKPYSGSARVRSRVAAWRRKASTAQEAGFWELTSGPFHCFQCVIHGCRFACSTSALQLSTILRLRLSEAESSLPCVCSPCQKLSMRNRPASMALRPQHPSSSTSLRHGLKQSRIDSAYLPHQRYLQQRLMVILWWHMLGLFKGVVGASIITNIMVSGSRCSYDTIHITLKTRF